MHLKAGMTSSRQYNYYGITQCYISHPDVPSRGKDFSPVTNVFIAATHYKFSYSSLNILKGVSAIKRCTKLYAKR